MAGRKFDTFPLQTITDETLRVYVFDESQAADSRDRRQVISLLLGGRADTDLSNLDSPATARTNLGDVLTEAQIDAKIAAAAGSSFTRVGAAASLTFNNDTWKSTGRIVPSSATWVRVVSYLPEAVGTWTQSAALWRGLADASGGDAVVDADRIPLFSTLYNLARVEFSLGKDSSDRALLAWGRGRSWARGSQCGDMDIMRLARLITLLAAAGPGAGLGAVHYQRTRRGDDIQRHARGCCVGPKRDESVLDATKRMALSLLPAGSVVAEGLRPSLTSPILRQRSRLVSACRGTTPGPSWCSAPAAPAGAAARLRSSDSRMFHRHSSI